jgi:hypothetical protein
VYEANSLAVKINWISASQSELISGEISYQFTSPNISYLSQKDSFLLLMKRRNEKLQLCSILTQYI